MYTRFSAFEIFNTVFFFHIFHQVWILIILNDNKFFSSFLYIFKTQNSDWSNYKKCFLVLLHLEPRFSIIKSVFIVIECHCHFLSYLFYFMQILYWYYYFLWVGIVCGIMFSSHDGPEVTSSFVCKPPYVYDAEHDECGMFFLYWKYKIKK